jgi:hypothetical protein
MVAVICKRIYYYFKEISLIEIQLQQSALLQTTNSKSSEFNITTFTQIMNVVFSECAAHVLSLLNGALRH